MRVILFFIFFCFQAQLHAQYLELKVNVLNLKESEYAKVVLINNTTGAKDTTKYRFKSFPVLLRMDNSYKVIIASDNYATKTFDVDLTCGPENNKAVFEMEVAMVAAAPAPVVASKAKTPKPTIQKGTTAGYIKYVEKDKKLSYKIEKNKAGTISCI